jgi:predicted O-methyltransferase YrrM
MLGRIVRAVFRHIWTSANLDIRSVRARLDRIGVVGSDASGVLPPKHPAEVDDWLLELVLRVLRRAKRLSADALLDRGAPLLVATWPGEHYRLIAAIVEDLKPRVVIEIGTYTGLRALAIKAALAPGAKLVTFDVVSWDSFEDTYRRDGDFLDGAVSQEGADMGDMNVAHRFRDLLAVADMIFIDASKDGSLEARILEAFRAVGLTQGTLLVLDDIRVWNLVEIWRDIERPKIDLTGFGHYSGTGWVRWVEPLAFE